MFWFASNFGKTIFIDQFTGLIVRRKRRFFTFTVKKAKIKKKGSIRSIDAQGKWHEISMTDAFVHPLP